MKLGERSSRERMKSIDLVFSAEEPQGEWFNLEQDFTSADQEYLSWLCESLKSLNRVVDFAEVVSTFVFALGHRPKKFDFSPTELEKYVKSWREVTTLTPWVLANLFIPYPEARPLAESFITAVKRDGQARPSEVMDKGIGYYWMMDPAHKQDWVVDQAGLEAKQQRCLKYMQSGDAGNLTLLNFNLIDLLLIDPTFRTRISEPQEVIKNLRFLARKKRQEREKSPEAAKQFCRITQAIIFLSARKVEVTKDGSLEIWPRQEGRPMVQTPLPDRSLV